MFKIYLQGHMVSGIKSSKLNFFEQFRTNGKLKQKTVIFTALFVIIVSEASSTLVVHSRRGSLPQRSIDPTETTKSKLSKIQTRRGKY